MAAEGYGVWGIGPSKVIAPRARLMGDAIHFPTNQLGGCKMLWVGEVMVFQRCELREVQLYMQRNHIRQTNITLVVVVAEVGFVPASAVETPVTASVSETIILALAAKAPALMSSNGIMTGGS